MFDQPVPPTIFEQRIRKYLANYYDELQVQMNKYRAIPEAIPSFLKGEKYTLVVMVTNGVILIEYSIEGSSVDFVDQSDVDADLYLFHAANRLGLWFQSADFELGSSYEMMIPNGDVPGENGVMHRLFLFDRMIISGRVDEIRWSEDLAIANAQNDVKTAVTAHLLHLADPKPEAVASKLQVLLRDFEVLIDTEPLEEDIQRYLADNPGLLDPTAGQIIPKIKLGAEYITDFVIEYSESQYVLVEIEPSKHKHFTNAGNPTANLTHAQRQVEDWLEWLQDNIAYARNSMPGISDPECWIITGRSVDLNERDKKALLRKNKELQRIKIFTYDNAIDKNKRHLAFIQQLEC